MKFCDKLQKLRKENNITQETLADKLNVSRQAVSKWESGVGYPDTEKLIMLSKILNVSLDELVNDKEIVKNNDNEKISFKEMINSSLEFITKSIEMFSMMKFKEKIKFLFEMIIIFLVILCFSFIITNTIESLFRRIFMFLPYDILCGLTNLIEALLYIIEIFLGSIILVRIFKSRYLDYYVFIKDNSTVEKVIEKPIDELKNSKDIKIVIRDPKDSSLNIFNKIWNICLFLIKCFCILIVIPLIILFIFLVGLLIISMFYITYGILFNGISIIIIGSILFIYLLIEFIYNIIFNQKHNYHRKFLIFMISIILMGIGLGLVVSDFPNYSIVEDEYIKDSKIISVKDNLVFNELDDEKIVIDDSIDYIKVDFLKLKNVELILYEYTDYSDNYQYINICSDYLEFDFYKDVIDRLKNKEILVYDDLWEIDKIYISSNNLELIKNNNEKYLY